MTIHVVKAPAGLGKTTAVLEQIKGSPHARIEIYVPTIQLAEELHAKIVASGETALISRGRSQEIDRKPMCRYAWRAEQISKLGYPVFPILCMGTTTPGDKKTFRSCDYFSSCDYLQQYDTTARIVIFTHAYLVLPRNNREVIPPALVIIDESFLLTCLQTYDLPRGKLVEFAKSDAKLVKLLNTLLKAVDDGLPLLAALRTADITEDALKELGQHVLENRLPVPFESRDWSSTRQPELEPRIRLDLLIEILAAELATGRDSSHGITFDPNAQTITLHYRAPITRFQTGATAPTFIIIDANADPDLIGCWFKDVKFEEIRADRNAYVIQCKGATGSTTSFVPAKNKDPESAARAAKRLVGLAELIKFEAAGGEKKVLVVGPQAITGNKASKVLPLVKRPKNGALAHFNALRGVDTFKDFDTAIIIGRNQPPIAEVEKLARALWYDSATALEFAEDWIKEARPYWLRDPTNPLGTEVQVHPDARIQRLHEQMREGESTQAIDRLRLIHATTPKRVLIVSNLPLDIEVDELVDLNAMLFRTRVDRAWEQLKGVMPLNPEWLAKTFPELWRTPSAAASDVRVGRKGCQISNIYTISNLTGFGYEYRVGGKRQRSRAVSVLPLSQTQDELTRLLGVPVAIRSRSEDKTGPEHFGAMGAALLPPLTAQGSARSPANTLPLAPHNA